MRVLNALLEVGAQIGIVLGRQTPKPIDSLLDKKRVHDKM